MLDYLSVAIFGTLKESYFSADYYAKMIQCTAYSGFSTSGNPNIQLVVNGYVDKNKNKKTATAIIHMGKSIFKILTGNCLLNNFL